MPYLQYVTTPLKGLKTDAANKIQRPVTKPNKLVQTEGFNGVGVPNRAGNSILLLDPF